MRLPRDTTLTVAKQQVRAALALMARLRRTVNDHMRTGPVTGIYVSLADYELLEFGMRKLIKQWVPDLDEQQEPLRTGRLVRVHGGYCINDGTQNQIFKGIPVRVGSEERVMT